MTQDSTVRTSCRLLWGGLPMLANWAAEMWLPSSSLDFRRDAGWLVGETWGPFRLNAHMYSRGGLLEGARSLLIPQIMVLRLRVCPWPKAASLFWTAVAPSIFVFSLDFMLLWPRNPWELLL